MIDWIFWSTCLCSAFCTGIFFRDAVRARRKKKPTARNYLLSGFMCLGFAGWTADRLGLLPRYAGSTILALGFVVSLMGVVTLLHQEMQTHGTRR